MPAQHGQTYDPQEEPSSRGGWFQLHDRPFPERLDKAFRWAAACLGAAVAVCGTAGALYVMLTSGDTRNAWAPFVLIAIAAAMAYGLARGIGMVLVSLYSILRDGSEITIDTRAVRHDIRLRRTWIVLLEGALLLAAVVVAGWGLILFWKRGEVFGLATFAVIVGMIYWPPIRRWIADGRTRG